MSTLNIVCLIVIILCTVGFFYYRKKSKEIPQAGDPWLEAGGAMIDIKMIACVIIALIAAGIWAV